MKAISQLLVLLKKMRIDCSMGNIFGYLREKQQYSLLYASFGVVIAVVSATLLLSPPVLAGDCKNYRDLSTCPDNANVSPDGQSINYGGDIFTLVPASDVDQDTKNYSPKATAWYSFSPSMDAMQFIPIEGRLQDAKQTIIIARSPVRAIGVIGTKSISIGNGLGGGASQTTSLFTDNVDKTCQTVDKANKEACKNKILKATNECIAARPDLANNYDELLKCVAQKTNYPLDSLFSLTVLENNKNEKPVCVVAQVGWAVCPIARFMAKLTDGVFKVIEKYMVYDTIVKGGNDLQKSWGYMRSIANVAFILAFLFVIYSQLTGKGVDNYGIKKLLPRIIVGAVLVNISFWICAAAADVSNVIGHSLRDVLKAVVVQAPADASFEKVTAGILAGTGLAGIGIASVSVAGATISGALYAALGFLMPLLISVIIAAAIVVIILTARQAIITVLIVLSPIAFVAFLLPNTQKWFDKWRGIFMSMLLMYPIIALIFGLSEFTGNVLLSVGGGVAMTIAGLAAYGLPLFMVPFILKRGGGMFRFGSILSGKLKGLGGKVGEKSKGFTGRKQKEASARLLNSNSGFGSIIATKGGDGWLKKRGRKAIGALGGGSAFRQMNREEKTTAAATSLAFAQEKYKRERLMNDPSKALSLGAGSQRLADAIVAAANQKELEDQQKMFAAHQFMFSSATIDQVRKVLEEAMEDEGSHTAEEVAAALERYSELGELSPSTDANGAPLEPGFIRYVDHYIGRNRGGTGQEPPQIISESIAKSLSENAPGLLLDEDILAIGDGHYRLNPASITPSGTMSYYPDFASVTRTNLANGSMREKQMATCHPSVLDYAVSVADAAGWQQLQQTADSIRNNPKLYSNMYSTAQLDRFPIRTRGLPLDPRYTNGPGRGRS